LNVNPNEGGFLLAYYAGVDIGGTKIAVGIGRETGDILGEGRLMTSEFTDGDKGLDAIAGEIKELCDKLGISMDSLSRIGVGSPGPLDGGKLLKTANLPTWEGVDLSAGLKLRTGRPTAVENDATAAAIGEWQFGAGKGLQHFVYVTVSTGVGSGIVVNGSRYAGIQGNAGEIGHMVMKPQGSVCRCGRRGCLETLASGTAIQQRAMERAESSPYLKTMATIEAQDVFAGAVKGDLTCQSIIREASQYLGLGLSYLVNLFNPQALILGGGVMVNQPEWLNIIIPFVAEYSMADLFQPVNIALAQLGTDSGLLGAIATAVTSQI
jgi:glucokinase